MYVTDTHPLVYYAVGRHNYLSVSALTIFQMADAGQVTIWVPSIVLWEISCLIYTGKIRLRESFEGWCHNLSQQRCFGIIELNPDVVCIAHGMAFKDRVDALIAATARHLDLPLITRDHVITDSNLVDVMW